MVHYNNKQVVFLGQPTHFPIVGEHLGVQTVQVNSDLKENDILLRNLYVSVDPYLRGRMADNKNAHIPGFQLGKPFSSAGVSEVIQSRNPAFPIGAIVMGITNWEESSHVPAAAASQFKVLEDARESKFPLRYCIGALGNASFTAYGSLKRIGQPTKGETLFVSAASGAVGQIAGQLAKLWGLKVVGSAGTDEKVEFLLKELKFDAAFNYKKGSILENLRKCAPQGIDIYFDNTGGEALEAALDVMNIHGRVIACGHISAYNGQEPYGIRNMVQVIGKRITIRGFVVIDFEKEERANFRREVSEHLLRGDIVYKEDIIEGLDEAPAAFVGQLRGERFGKVIIKIADL
ncbi:MAG: reductase RED1 [Podila humilis]|nr:MAG: reductase RED1 [Podila humilis]